MLNEPEKLASHLRSSLIKKLEALAAKEAQAHTQEKEASSPPPPPLPLCAPAPVPLQKKMAVLSQEEKNARLMSASPAVWMVADMLNGPLQGPEAKFGALIASETFKQAAADLSEWAPKSQPVLDNVIKQAGLTKTAETRGVTTEYLGRLLAHGIVARNMEKMALGMSKESGILEYLKELFLGENVVPKARFADIPTLQNLRPDMTPPPAPTTPVPAT